MMMVIIFLILKILTLTQGLSNFLQRNMDLVSTISPTIKVEEGETVEMECRLGNIPDRAEVAWVRILGVMEVEYLSIYDKKDGSKDYEEEQFISTMEESPGGSFVWSLTINRVTKNMGGLYQCQVLINDEVVSTKKVLLTITSTDKLEHNVKYVVTKQGGNITLDCTEFEGEDVSWTRLGETSGVKNGRHLSLIRVDRSDSGIYVCSVSGSPKSMNISLLVEHSPTITPTQVMVTQSPGYAASLSCEVAGVPVPSVSWYSLMTPQGPTMMKSQADLSLVIDDYKDGKMISSLLFHNITTQQFGQYSCNASNRLGQTSSVLQLLFSPTPVVESSARIASQGSAWIMLLWLGLGLKGGDILR